MERCSRLLLTSALACALACAQPFPLPGAPIGPTIAGFTPASGYAGDLVTIEGANFDPTPENNEVIFPWESARASGFDAQGRLLVTVPEGPDTGMLEGPLVVVTPLGRSAAFGDFNYHGLGHPNVGAHLADVRVLHKPEGIVAANDDVYLASAYFRLLLGARHPGYEVQLPSKPHGVAASDDGSTLFVAFADDGVWAVDSQSGEVKAKTALDGIFIRQIVAVRHGSDVAVHAVGNDRNSGVVLVSLHGATLAADPVRRLPLRSLGAAHLSSDGRTLWVTGSRDGSARVENGLLGISTGDTTAVPSWNVLPGNLGVTGPVVVSPWEGRDLVSVATEENTLAIFDAGTRTWNAQTVFTGSGTRITDMVGVTANDPAGGPERIPAVVVAKPDDEDIVALSPVTHAIVWTSWTATQPRALAWDAAKRRVFVADDSTNVVDEVQSDDGVYVQRHTFDAGLGSAENTRFGPVPDFNPDDASGNHHMLVLSRRFRRLVPLNDDTLELDLSPFLLDPTASPPVGLVNALDGTVFVVHEKEIGRFGNFQEKPRKTTEQLVIRDLDSEPARVVAVDATTLLVGSQRRVDLWKAGSDGTWQKAGPGVAHEKGHVEELFVRPDGKVLALWNDVDANEPHLSGGLWTLDGLAQNGLPVASYEQSNRVHGYFGAAALENGTTLFFNWCDDVSAQVTRTGRCALVLDDVLKPSEARFSMVKEVGPIAATPDHRYLLWARFALRDQVLRLGKLGWDDAGTTRLLADWTSWRTPGDFTSAGIDPSGEWVYVAVPSLDQISVFK